MNQRNLLLLTLLLLTPLVARAAGDVSFRSTAEIEVREVNAKGETLVLRRPAEVVAPGEVVIYSNIVTNAGREANEKLVVTNPVPNSSEYLAGSAEGTVADVVFSIDGGKSFAVAKALFVPDGKGGKRPAEAKEYTAIRWTLKAPLKPGATALVEFRARVK